MIDVHDSQAELSRLLDACAAGERVVIARDGVPVAELVPYEPEGKQRPLGLAAHEHIVVHDDFDVMTEDELAEWGM